MICQMAQSCEFDVVAGHPMWGGQNIVIDVGAIANAAVTVCQIDLRLSDPVAIEGEEISFPLEDGLAVQERRGLLGAG